jgi:bla regulator protein blaR1
MRKYGVVCLVAATIALPMSSGPRAQSTNGFDVASVKPNMSGAPGLDIDTQPGGRLTITNASLRNLITFAYRIQDNQLVGGPDWQRTARFDVVAKAEKAATTEELLVMLRPLLGERFKLAVHHESRELPIYALVVQRADGRTGGQLKTSDVDCSGLPGTGSRGCAFSVSFGNIRARGMPVARLAAALSPFAGRIVVDRTGISGPHDFDLTWTPDQFRGRQTAPGEQPPQVNGRIVDANGPSLFTAIQEQLGLKLESTTGPVDVLVIDGAERPVGE